jgi:hypothetical protein
VREQIECEIYHSTFDIISTLLIWLLNPIINQDELPPIWPLILAMVVVLIRETPTTKGYFWVNQYHLFERNQRCHSFGHLFSDHISIAENRSEWQPPFSDGL